MAGRAGRWLRVSGASQDEEDQLPEINDWCEQHGYVVTDDTVYEVHGKSAYKGQQMPDWDRVVADVEAGKINVVVVWMVDRLDRANILHAIPMVNRVLEAGGRIEFAAQPFIDLRTDEGVRAFGDFVANAKAESKIKSARIIKTHAKIRRNGALIGRPPFGWDIAGTKYDKHLVINDAEVEIAREMVRRYLDGESLGELLADFNRRGITAKHGAAWSEASMAQYLHLPTLYGSRPSGGSTQDVPAIIDFATWQKVQDRMAARNRKTGGRVTSTLALLSGVLHCPAGHKMHLTNSGYYCRFCPKGERLLVPRETAELAMLSWYELEVAHEPEIITENATDDRQQQVNRLSADIQRMNPSTTPDYLTMVTAKMAAIQELQADLAARPRLAPVTRETGRSKGDAFAVASEVEQREILRKIPLTITRTGVREFRITSSFNGGTIITIVQ